MAIRTESPGAARGDGANSGENGGPWAPSQDAQRSPATPHGPGDSFRATPAVPDGGLSFPGSGVSFPGAPTETRGFPSSSDLFSRSSADGPAFPPSGASFPATEPAGFPEGGPSFPATPAEPVVWPRGLMPGDGSGDSTESFPSVGSGGGGPLPRRIPLSERTGSFPPTPRPHDDDAFRLFPFGKDADTPPAAPPSENTED